MWLKGVIGLLVGMVVFACRSDHVGITVSFDALNGLQRKDRVLFENNPAGTIETIEYRPDGTYATLLEIDKAFAAALTEYTQFRMIEDPGISGHKAVEIHVTHLGGTPLPDGALVKGISTSGPLLKKDLEAGLNFLKEQVDRLAREIQQIPESDAYRRIKESLSGLAEEIARSEEKTRQKLKQEWLPKIEKDLEALKKRLHELGREEEARPLENELDRIRKI
jgi:ABC-type transporter Mla subunit MlaD